MHDAGAEQAEQDRRSSSLRIAADPARSCGSAITSEARCCGDRRVVEGEHQNTSGQSRGTRSQLPGVGAGADGDRQRIVGLAQRLLAIAGPACARPAGLDHAEATGRRHRGSRSGRAESAPSMT